MWVIKSRRVRWLGHVARIGDRRGVFRLLVRKPKGKRPHERHRRRWEDDIKMDLQVVGCWGMDWVELAQIGRGGRHFVFFLLVLY